MQVCFPESFRTLKFFFFLTFIGLQLLYNVVLVSTVQLSESAIRIHISSLFWISFSFRSPQSIEQSSLCYTVGSHKLSILYIVSILYICQSQYPNSSHLPRLPPLVSIRSQYFKVFNSPHIFSLLNLNTHTFLSLQTGRYLEKTSSVITVTYSNNCFINNRILDSNISCHLYSAIQDESTFL